MLLTLLTAAVLPLTIAAANTTCFRPIGRLPLEMDCLELIEAIRQTSFRPTESGMKRWGPDLPDGRDTRSLPQTFVVHRPPKAIPNTCAIYVDADMPGWDEFKMQRITGAAIVLTSACLTQRNKVGRTFLVDDGIVFAELGRSNFPRPGALQYSSNNQSSAPSWDVSTGNGTSQLLMIPGPRPIDISTQEPETIVS